MGTHRRKQELIADRALHELAQLACHRIHKSIDLSMQLVPERGQQLTLAVLVIAYQIDLAAGMLKLTLPRDRRYAEILDFAKSLLDRWPED